MELLKINVGENEYSFCNESGNTRNGFYHRSVLFNQYGRRIGENKVNYLNRTWECYRYQTVMRGLVCGLIESREDILKAEFKAVKGIKSLTKKYKEEYEAYVNKDANIKLYREILEKLK